MDGHLSLEDSDPNNDNKTSPELSSSKSKKSKKKMTINMVGFKCSKCDFKTTMSTLFASHLKSDH